jgi:hypothetical protein
MNEKSDQISCPTCEKIVFNRGLFGHLRFGHGKTPEEAHEIMSSLYEPLHGSLDEKTPEEAESVSPGGPPDPGGPEKERRKINLYPPYSPFDRRERE